MYLGLTLVGEELSDLDDFFVGELEGETWSTIRTIPGIWPPVPPHVHSVDNQMNRVRLN